MKFIAFLVICVALCAGILAAATAYSPSIEREDLIPPKSDDPAQPYALYEINAPAGVVVLDAELWDRVKSSGAESSDPESSESGTIDPDSIANLSDRRSVELLLGRTDLDQLVRDSDTGVMRNQTLALMPMFEAGVELSPEVLEAIRANAERLAGTRYATTSVRLKSFGVSRWTYSWAFALAAAGLVASGFVIRFSGRSVEGGSAAATHGPADSLRMACEELNLIVRDVGTLSNESERLHTILHRLDSVQERHLQPFIDNRETLSRELGLKHYAQLMDVFAFAERALNRSWSAAADHVHDESIECLQIGASRLADAVERLGSV